MIIQSCEIFYKTIYDIYTLHCIQEFPRDENGRPKYSVRRDSELDRNLLRDTFQRLNFTVHAYDDEKMERVKKIIEDGILN